MTIMDAIYRIDVIKPNSYSQSEKIKWLSTLDGTVKREIIDTHDECERKGDCVKHKEFGGYNENTVLSTELLIPAPYDDIYLRWLEAQIDYANGEYGKFNNSIAMYNTAYVALTNYYNRTHMPISKQSRFI